MIFDLAIKHSEGIVVDICKRVKSKNIYLSDKQRWCVAFAFLTITAQQVTEFEEEGVSASLKLFGCFTSRLRISTGCGHS